MIEVRNETGNSLVCSSAQWPQTTLARLRGLLGTDFLAPDGGLLLSPSSGVHTFGMRFPIDIVALDRKLRVVGLWHAVPPGRVCGLGFSTHSVLELSSGRIRSCGLALGHQLSIHPVAKAA